MMTRVLLTFLVGLTVSLGTLVSAGSGVAWAGNWNLSNTKKVSATITSLNDQKLCFYATTQYSTGRVLDYIWNTDPSYKGHVEEAKRRSLTCNVNEKLNKKLSAKSMKQPTSRLIGETANVFTNQPDHNVCLNVQVNADAQVEAKRRNLGCGVDKDRQDADKIRKKLASRDFGAAQICLWLKEAKKSSPAYHAYSDEAKRRSLVCPCINYPNNSECHERLAEVDNTWLCYHAVTAGNWSQNFSKHVQEAKRRGLSCGVHDNKKSAAIGSASIQSGIPDASKIPLLTNDKICGWLHAATRSGATAGAGASGKYEEPLPLNKNNLRLISALLDEGMRRSLSCSSLLKFNTMDNSSVCDLATLKIKEKIYWAPWTTINSKSQIIAKMRGLSCGVGEERRVASLASSKASSEFLVCDEIYHRLFKRNRLSDVTLFSLVDKARSEGFTCSATDTNAARRLMIVAGFDDTAICDKAALKIKGKSYWAPSSSLATDNYKIEARRRGLSCGVGETTQTASAPKVKPKATSAALTAAEKEAERLRQELAALRAEKAKQQQTISSDTQKPTIQIAGTASNGPQGTIKGFVRDNTGIAEVRVDGQLVKVDSYGNFMANTYVPEGGVSVSIQAVDLAGLSSSMSVRLERSISNTTASISFERLNPLGRKVAKNKNALALIIGVDGYENTPARAIYADSDAKVFADYASQKLGIPSNRIKTLVNNGADEKGMLLAVKDWLSRASKKDKSDVYVFFAGHGLASQDGKKMYLLPYDGSPRLLEKTAILRDELFSDIASTNPRSVTVFLDTCYSGETRGNEMLIAGRPIGIRVLEQSIPDNFTLMTAAAGDQIANPLKEAKHGMFSYFLMKGMEGVADTNQDNKITALELHEYVKENVWQQSSNKQLPELQGDAERVLVRFQ